MATVRIPTHAYTVGVCICRYNQVYAQICAVMSPSDVRTSTRSVPTAGHVLRGEILSLPWHGLAHNS